MMVDDTKQLRGDMLDSIKHEHQRTEAPVVTLGEPAHGPEPVGKSDNE